MVSKDHLGYVIGYVRESVVLVVTKLDRLACSMANLVDITETLKAKGAELQVLAVNFDTSGQTQGLYC